MSEEQANDEYAKKELHAFEEWEKLFDKAILMNAREVEPSITKKDVKGATNPDPADRSRVVAVSIMGESDYVLLADVEENAVMLAADEQHAGRVTIQLLQDKATTILVNTEEQAKVIVRALARAFGTQIMNGVNCRHGVDALEECHDCFDDDVKAGKI